MCAWCRCTLSIAKGCYGADSELTGCRGNRHLFSHLTNERYCTTQMEDMHTKGRANKNMLMRRSSTKQVLRMCRATVLYSDMIVNFSIPSRILHRGTLNYIFKLPQASPTHMHTTFAIWCMRLGNARTRAVAFLFMCFQES